MNIFEQLGRDIANTIGEDLTYEYDGVQSTVKAVYKATTIGFDGGGNKVLVPEPSCFIPRTSGLVPEVGALIYRLGNTYEVSSVYDDGKSAYKTMLQDITE